MPPPTRKDQTQADPSPAATGLPPDPVAPPPRPVKYPKVRAHVYDADDPLTVRRAMDLLGWKAEKGEERFGTDYLFEDRLGVRVRCLNNPINRPFYASNATRLMQDVLNGRWELNGEPVIIGRTGLILNGQHTLAALVWAEQERLHGKDKDHWAGRWPGEVTIKKVVVYGIEEVDDVVNTMDTAKTRSFMDVLYRCPYFADLSEKDRRQAAGMCDNAVRLLWERTHAAADPYSPTRTFAEGLSFIDRHPRLLEAVRHVQGEAGGDRGRLAALRVGPGTAAGLLYLMAACGSDPVRYRADRQEVSLDLGHWDRAEEFWTLLAGDSAEFDGFRRAVSYANESGAGGRRNEMLALLVRAWTDYWLPGKPMTPSAGPTGAADQPLPGLKLQYRVDPLDGARTLIECPVVGGVDFGLQEEAPPPDGAPPPATDEDLEEAKEQVHKDRDAKVRKAPSKVAAELGRPLKPADRLKQDLARLKFQTDGRVLFFRTGGGPLVLWEADAAAYAKYTGKVCGQHKETAMFQMHVQPDQLDAAVRLFLDRGGKASAALTEDPNGEGADRWIVENLDPPKARSLTEEEPAATTPAPPPPALPVKPTPPRPGSGPKSVAPGTRPKVKLRGGTGG